MRRTRHYLTGRSFWMAGAMLGSLLVMLMLTACGSSTEHGWTGKSARPNRNNTFANAELRHIT